MSFLSSTRSVLLMGDEGLQIFLVKKGKTTLISYVPWSEESFIRTVSSILVKKCQRSSAVIVNDMAEQHYRKEVIPKVSPLDKGSVIKRRLGLAFPNYKVRAAMKLKDKPAGDSAGCTSYLFAAVAATDFYKNTLKAVEKSGVSIAGFHLLPIESSMMVRAAEKKLPKERGFKPAWTILAGQHHNGGLRQVVTKNGELALTRMTPIIDTDVEPDLWAREVASELESTMSYLTRFGYKETDGLNVIVVANEVAHTALEEFIKTDGRLYAMNSQEFSEFLGFNIGPQEDFRYADVAHAGFLGSKSKLLLPLKSVDLTRLETPQKIASLLTWGLLAGCAYLAFMAFQSGQKVVSAKDKMVVLEQKSKSLEAEYNIELGKKKEIGFDFLLVNNAIDIYDKFNKDKIKPLALVRDIGKSLGVDVHLDKVNFKIDEVRTTNRNSGNDQNEKTLSVLLTLSFPSSINPDISVARVNSIRDRIEDLTDGYDVRVIKQIADLSYTGNFSGESGTSLSQTPRDYTAEIEIKGALK